MEHGKNDPHTFRRLSLIVVAQCDRVEIACETILLGRVKVVITGGFDNFREEGSYKFANTGATNNTYTEFAMGQEPNEMSHPTASTREGVSFSHCWH